MSAKLSFYAVLLLALSAAGEKDIPNSLEGRVNNFGDHHAPITSLGTELDTNEIPTMENKISKEDHSVENDTTVPRLRIPSTDSPLPKSTSAIPEGCGKVSKRFRRIVGGRDSRFGKHPWQAALYDSNPPAKPYCGGTLLTDRWVITAGHCVDNKNIKTLTVRLGEYNTEKFVEKLPHKDYKIAMERVPVENERYLDRVDIALLKLDKIVKFDQHIVPVCLPPRNVDLSGQIATVSGWGMREEGNIKSKPAILNEIEVEVFSHKICEQWYSKAGKKIHFFDGLLCASNKNGGKNICKGDSGGPLTIKINDRRVLIGVVVGGINCGKDSLPGIYTNVTKYLNWIQTVIKS